MRLGPPPPPPALRGGEEQHPPGWRISPNRIITSSNPSSGMKRSATVPTVVDGGNVKPIELASDRAFAYSSGSSAAV